MKASIGLEIIGGSSVWIAEIKGFSKKYLFDREFLDKNKDYTDANSVGTRGIKCWYMLETGCVYEVQRQISWKKSEKYFCCVNADGEIIRLTREDVIKYCERLEAIQTNTQNYVKTGRFENIVV
jgi:hypothetical protein